jgi:hypothetical protein
LKINPVLEIHYHNEEVWTNPTTDNIRREECLCLHCKKMTYDKETNCPIAQQMYELCCKENIAFIMTRCKVFDLNLINKLK